MNDLCIGRVLHSKDTERTGNAIVCGITESDHGLGTLYHIRTDFGNTYRMTRGEVDGAFNITDRIDDPVQRLKDQLEKINDALNARKTTELVEQTPWPEGTCMKGDSCECWPEAAAGCVSYRLALNSQKTTEQESCAFCGKMDEEVCDTRPVDICEKALGALQLAPGTNIADLPTEPKESASRAAGTVSGDQRQPDCDGNNGVKGTMSGNNWYLTARERIMIRARGIAAAGTGRVYLDNSIRAMALRVATRHEQWGEVAALALVLAGAVKP